MNAKFLFTLLLLHGFQAIHAENYPSFAPATRCLACDVPNGLQVVSVSGDSATLSWNAVAGAGQYTLEVEDEQNVPSTFHLEVNVNTTSYIVTGLQPGVLYKFKVRARCGGDKSDWSSFLFFNAATGGNGGGNGSGPCAIPAQLSVVVAGGVTTLSWSPVPGATQYFIEIEDEQNQPSTFHLEVPVQDTFYVLNNLQSGVLYKFKVRTHCGSNQSDWSTWLFFNGSGSGGPFGGSSGSCSRPTFLQVTNLTMNSALLTWNPAPGVNAYTLEIEKESPGAPWQTTLVVQTNSFLVTGLEQNTRYKFKVRSNCPGGGHSSWTKWRKFKTPNSFTGTAGGTGFTGSKTVVEDRTELESEMEELSLHIMPNPATTEVLVRIQTLRDEPFTLRMFDISGRQVLQRNGQGVEGNSVEWLLSVEQLTNGCYFLQLTTGAQTRLQKLVVTH